MRRLFVFVVLLGVRAFGAAWVSETPADDSFALVHDGRTATIVAAEDDFKVVRLAAADLQRDIERVSGQRPALQTTAAGAGSLVLVGTLGHSPLIDRLVAAGRLDVEKLRGQWESFLIATVPNPATGTSSTLVVVGSDRRGTAFGIYELAQAIGVSPWQWWADVAPAKRPALFVAAGTQRFGPPSVQYRGIFLNDEDWGLQPWAAKTFEPETGDIGPKTYAKVCELLLRLKANTLWPAMHECTQAFNLNPQNKRVADDYAIVMGSSHAEPLLRNNVTEWTAPHEDYNYLKNRDGVRAYWETRVKENGKFENIYTLGMRGIHDSYMQGPKTDAERIATLEQIFADQRALLTQHVNPHVEQVPQMFCAYKEVLALYRQGLKVPDDVTIVWPDDNFGYIRNVASAAERGRSGGFGVYYHLSYLGAPLSYLWLSTTPPAVIWTELSKAYDHGARKIWIVNVGDLKPAEIGTEFFLQMAWDINRWNRDNLGDFLFEWASREFGRSPARAIAAVMDDYYKLNFARRPEHLQWWLPKQAPQPSPLMPTEIKNRLNAFQYLRETAERIATTLPAEKRDAYEELVGYPVRGSALANLRYFQGERGDCAAAEAADAELKETTRRFNEQIAGGKWRNLIALEPADEKWLKQFRLAAWTMPDFPQKTKPPPAVELTIPTTEFSARADRNNVGWKTISDLGVSLFPTTAGSFDPARLADAPQLDYEIEVPIAGDYTLTLFLLPTHSLVPDTGLRVGVSINDRPARLLTYDGKDGSPEWAQGVLNNSVALSVPFTATAGVNKVRLLGIDPGVVVTKLVIR